jgi:hypothetical protein
MKNLTFLLLFTSVVYGQGAYTGALVDLSMLLNGPGHTPHRS